MARKVRAFNPFPGASAEVDGVHLKIWRAHVHPGSGVPGTRLTGDSGPLVVACGEGALALEEVQKPGGKRQSADEYLRGLR